MRRQLLPAVMMMLVMTLLTGLVYTFVFTGVAQLLFPDAADGSRVEVNGEDVGSEHIGQAFADAHGEPLPEYFQSRPSAATGPDGTTEAGYDPRLSLGSNLGPTNPCLVRDPERPCVDDEGNEIPPLVVERVRAYRELNGLRDDQAVPVDAVTASASGLDPHISVANARLQEERIAEERGIPVRRVRALIDDNTSNRTIGFLGEKRVNVLLLNIALDRAAPMP
jgi:potassium-transporting ATPase KdpC subunit